MATVPVTYYNRPIESTIGTTIKVDFSKDLILDHEQEAPLTTLLNKLKDEKTTTNSFKFAEGRMAPRYSTANGAVGASAVGATATWTVVHGEYFVPGDVIECSDANNDATHTNQGYITAVSTNDLTVRPYDPATYGLCAVNDGDTIFRVGSAMVESSTGRNSSQTVPSVRTQYCTSFEDYYDVSMIQAENAQYTHPERVRLREECRKKHIIDHETTAWFSKIVLDTTTTGKPRYQLSGFREQISTNVLHYQAALSDIELFDFMVGVHNPAYSAGNKRMVFSSGDFLSSINKLALSGLRITPKESSWGVMITEVAFAGKVWEFIEAPMLSQYRAGQAAVTHPRYIKKRTLIPTRFEMNVQNPKDKFYSDGFYSVDSFELKLEEVSGWMMP
jgi:hypothetical protein